MVCSADTFGARIGTAPPAVALDPLAEKLLVLGARRIFEDLRAVAVEVSPKPAHKLRDD